MKKKISELELGDVIWANPGIGNHVCIVTSKVEWDYPMCHSIINLTSSCPDCESNCIKIDRLKIPRDWFGIRKEHSYVRLESPTSLCESPGRELEFTFYGNLITDYPDFWAIVCQKCTPSNSNLCNCGC
jgi:hypothetical protein